MSARIRVVRDAPLDGLVRDAPLDGVVRDAPTDGVMRDASRGGASAPGARRARGGWMARGGPPLPEPIPVVREASGRGIRPDGLPGPLPAGETLLWQGAPCWRSLARRCLHLRQIALYFALLAAVGLWRAFALGTAQMWFSLLTLVVLSGVALGLLAVFAVLVARTTTYTLTTRRVVMRVGVALGMSINLPFAQVEAASVRLHADGTGDIPLLLGGQTRIGWIMLWPHVRPWRLRRVQPMLRAVPDARRVAQLLSAALAESAGQERVAAPGIVPSGTSETRRGRAAVPVAASVAAPMAAMEGRA